MLITVEVNSGEVAGSGGGSSHGSPASGRAPFDVGDGDEHEGGLSVARGRRSRAGRARQRR